MHVCPVWMGHLLNIPLRRLIHDPDTLLSPYVRDGMMVFDFGCAMGYFSLPLTRMVGPGGKVVCVDVQEGMLERLRRRASKAGLADRIETRLSDEADYGLGDLRNLFDFGLLFAVVHEVADSRLLIREVSKAMKPGGRVLFAEPKGHVPRQDFEINLVAAEEAGMPVVEHPKVVGCHAVLFQRE